MGSIELEYDFQRRCPPPAVAGEERVRRESDTQRVRLARMRRETAAYTWCGRAALSSLRRGGGGARAARELHVTCPPSALATRRRRHTHGAAERPRHPAAVAGEERERRESDTQKCPRRALATRRML
jgi:hypothetical protein